jgi:hypothetical protein
MKKLTYLLLALPLTLCLSQLTQADDMTITVTKATDSMAKVTPSPLGKGKTTIVPISFDPGASWDNVKDTYTVSPNTASMLAHKKETISIGTDGTASFHPLKKK